MIHYRILHTTTYAYSESVSLCQNVVHLAPRPCSRQQAERSVLNITPEPAVMEERVDYFGNPVGYFTIQEPHRELTVAVMHRVAVEAEPLPEAATTPAWEAVRDRLPADRSPEWLDACQFVYDSRYAGAAANLGAYAAPSFPANRPVLEAALDLTKRIHTDFVYDPRATTLATPVAEVFASRRGVCQDFAHLQIACLRSLGLAVRYVSGYLRTHTPPGQTRLVGADASHAWLAVYCPRQGWVEFDPTNGCLAGEGHIVVGWGRDFHDMSPVKGVVLGGGGSALRVAVDVTPL